MDEIIPGWFFGNRESLPSRRTGSASTTLGSPGAGSFSVDASVGRRTLEASEAAPEDHEPFLLGSEMCRDVRGGKQNQIPVLQQRGLLKFRTSTQERAERSILLPGTDKNQIS